MLSLRDVRVPDEPERGDPVTVRAYVLNHGTGAGNATVTVSLGNGTRTRTARVPAGEDAVVEVRFPASDVPDGGEVPVVVSMGDARVDRTVSVVDTTLPTATWRTTTRTEPTGSEPWPTLADGERRPASDPLPGFGPVAALSALAVALALVARRVRTDADGDAD